MYYVTVIIWVVRYREKVFYFLGVYSFPVWERVQTSLYQYELVQNCKISAVLFCSLLYSAGSPGFRLDFAPEFCGLPAGNKHTGTQIFQIKKSSIWCPESKLGWRKVMESRTISQVKTGCTVGREAISVRRWSNKDGLTDGLISYSASRPMATRMNGACSR